MRATVNHLIRDRGDRYADGATMTLLAHLAELRRRIVFCALAVVAGTIVGYVMFEPVFNFLTRPLCDLPESVRETLNSNTCFVFRDVTGAFAFRLKLALITGVALTAPFWLYQLWAFFAPALHRRERRWTYGFVAIGTPLFATGAVIAYTVLHTAFRFLLGFTPPHATNLIDANSYVTWIAILIVVFGASFEAPLLIVMLNFAGALPADRLTKSRRVVWVVLSAYCAVVTPGQDMSTMLALFVPLYALYELSAYICRVHDRRVERERTAVSYIDRSQPNESLDTTEG